VTRWRLGTIRRQLVLWYLSVLAVVLLALGIFQSLTLSQYLDSTTATSMRQAALAGFRILGPCYIQTSKDLQQNAQILARLLGSHDTAVKIVTRSGETLADHGLGFPGEARPLHLSAATINRLIGTQSASIARARTTSTSTCVDSPSPGARRPPRRQGSMGNMVVRENGLMLIAIPLGPFGHPVGYALLGQSSASADATIRRTRLVFALGALVALVLAAVVALPLINRALRPLRRVAGTAEAIAGGDLERRANLPQSPDEIGRLGSAFDKMVDRLQTALTTATQSEERMRRFLADASHELRTPLTVLRGTSEVLLRQGSTERPEVMRALQDMNEEATRLSKLVDHLLTLTRLDTGQQFSPEVVPLRTMLEQFTDRYASAWPNRRIDLELVALNGATAYVDPEAVRHVVTNLIDNAARYSTAGRPITLGGTAHGDSVTLSVSDEGPGLSADDASRVFERFYRGSKSRSRQSGGTGLGLAIVRAIVEQSHGEVRIETGPDRGTTVFFTLPAGGSTTEPPS
jgi:signal transduction histidine kinase